MDLRAVGLSADAGGRQGAYTETLLGPGQIIVHRPGEPHAWKAVEDTDCLVFTRGPRAGDKYESDTFRLDVPLIS